MQQIIIFIRTRSDMITRVQLPILSLLYTFGSLYGIYLFHDNFMVIAAFITKNPDVIFTLNPGPTLKLFAFTALLIIGGSLGLVLSAVSLHVPRTAQSGWFTPILAWYMVILGAFNHFEESVVHFVAIFGIFLLIAAFIWTLVEPNPEIANA